jgi:2,3-bisphosphoglycerate-dependent phosphoglycerate mutase
MELYLIRHAQSRNNASLIYDPKDRVSDPELTEIGHQQAQAVGRHLRDGISPDQIVDAQMARDPNATSLRGFNIDKLYCSPMHRTLQTAWHIQQATGLTPHVWVDIHEHGGLFEEYEDERGIVGFPGKTRSEIAAEYPDYVLTDDITDAGWWTGTMEEITAAYGRAIRVAEQLDQMAKEDPKGRIAIVTHGTFMGALIKALLNQLPSDGLWYSHYNTAITRIDIYDNERRWVRSMNRVDHLPPELIT